MTSARVSCWGVMTKRPLSLHARIGLGLLVVVLTPVLVVLLLPTLLVALPGYWLYGQWLKVRWEQTWGRQGKRILLVYSRSPHWHGYIENNWLPRVAPHAVADWSDRSTWPKWAPLEIRAFRYWGGKRDFNPLALLFPKRGKVRALRFWQAFRDLKHGKKITLQTAETELFGFVDAIRREAV